MAELNNPDDVYTTKRLGQKLKERHIISDIYR